MKAGIMLPDPDGPVFYVYAETEIGGGSPDELTGEYVDLVKSLIEDHVMLSS